MPVKVSNPRDLLLALLADALYVERRLAGEVLRSVTLQVADAELRTLLERHLEETREHARACERAFLAVEAAPSAAYSDGFEALVRTHETVAGSIVTCELRDVWHAASGAHVEHYEIAVYRAVLMFAVANGFEVALEDVLVEEERMLGDLERATARLSSTAAPSS